MNTDRRHLITPGTWTSAMALGFGILSGDPVRAQGCVASRMEAPACSARQSAHDEPLESYNLRKGRWESSFGYRFFYSHRHFVGSIEQNGGPKAERDRRGSEVRNHVHIPTLGISYGVTDRLSLTANLPVLVAHRSGPPSSSRPFRQHTDARGISDLNVIARYWVGQPSRRATQNLSLGLGVKLPTGNEGAEDEVWVQDSATRTLVEVRRPVDQSIQPGDGGTGLLAELQAFKVVGGATVFASGSYLSNPKATNGVPTNRSRASDRFMSVADQYAARVGVGAPAPFVSGLGLSLAARLEGLPSEDLLGSSDGFRRPGYSVGIEPGVSYSWKGTLASLSVPYLVRRVRTQSVGDKQRSRETGQHVNGDAAFSDYVIIFGFSRRF